MIKHFTASYSASRAALNEAQRAFKQRRFWFGTNFCQPIYESVIIEAVANGRLNAPGFFADYETRQAYLKSIWVGDAYGSLDPLKDVNAAEKRINLGLTTRTQETLEINGGDYEKNYAQRSKEAELESTINSDDSGNDAIKTVIDSFGVGVRAGAITPTIDDENYFRDQIGLPAASSDVMEVWKEQPYRMPITLKDIGENEELAENESIREDQPNTLGDSDREAEDDSDDREA